MISIHADLIDQIVHFYHTQCLDGLKEDLLGSPAAERFQAPQVVVRKTFVATGGMRVNHHTAAQRLSGRGTPDDETVAAHQPPPVCAVPPAPSLHCRA